MDAAFPPVLAADLACSAGSPSATHATPDHLQVFVLTGAYPDVRSLLLQRGWVENGDPDSEFFDFKWCLRTKSMHATRLLRPQMVNHFSRASECLTTK